MADTLISRCHWSTNKLEDEFVGVKVQDKDISIHFPVGYRKIENIDDETVRVEILTLMKVIKEFSDKSGSMVTTKKGSEEIDFPLNSYLFIIQDFIANGYYFEREPQYKSSDRGKINWKRTIQQKRPQFNGNTAIYLNFITQRQIANYDSFITAVHEWCVYKSLNVLGWLYTSAKPPKPRVKFNKTIFETVVKDYLAHTFDDKKKQLFLHMLNVILSSEKDDGKFNYSYGTNSYNTVWEKMVDKAFGNDTRSDYYPSAKWQYFPSMKVMPDSHLEPDTIMLKDDKVFILDAKYYGQKLPQTSSIHKQITYGEYVEVEKGIDANNIYNAFIIPRDLSGSKSPISFVAVGVSDWKGNDKNYEKVLAFYVDTHYLMTHYKALGEKERNALASFIEKTMDEYNAKLVEKTS